MWASEWGEMPRKFKRVQYGVDIVPDTVPFANWSTGNSAKSESLRYVALLNSGETNANGIGWSMPLNAHSIRPKTGSWLVIPDTTPPTNEFGEVAP